MFYGIFEYFSNDKGGFNCFSARSEIELYLSVSLFCLLLYSVEEFCVKIFARDEDHGIAR